MSSVELPQLSRAFKEKVKTVLNPYFTKDYRDDVKNPVLLLNFLHQHSVIPRPGYDIQADPNKPFHWIGSCSVGPLNPADYKVSYAVGPLKAEVNASSKKKCKQKAAQMILDSFLNDEKMDMINYCDDPESQINLGIQSMSIGGSSSEESMEDQYYYETRAIQEPRNFYEDDLSGILFFDEMTLDNKTKSKSSGMKTSTNLSVLYVEPQCGVDTLLSASSQDEETKSPSPECKAENDLSSKDSKVEDSCIDMKRVSSDTSVESAKKPFWENTTDSSASSSSESSNQSSEDQRILFPNERIPVSDNLFVDFFDPFSRLRPKINGHVNGVRRENGLNGGGRSETTTGETSSSEALPKFPLELSQSNKTPFQILQEKAVKNFKLIPRSRIEKTENGFSCTLILDAHTGYGEGRTKKEAKLKAATGLLQILENLQQIDV